MAVTAQSSGSQAATVTTEHTLVDVAIAGVFNLHVDLNVMVAGDVLELRIYEIVLTSGTRRVVAFGRWCGVQPADDKIAVSIPVSTELTDAGALRFTLLQTKGTSRTYPWKVLRFQ